MRLWPALWVVAGAASVVASSHPPSPLGPSGPIARRHDHVELRTTELKKLARTPIGQLGVLAVRDGKLVPIPFQVDERQGRQIAMLDGAEPSADEKPGILDQDDVLVFLPCDAGARATPEMLRRRPALSPGAKCRSTIRSMARGFAYVVVADAPPRPEALRRVRAGADLVTAAMYQLGMVRRCPTSSRSR
jgi:hypothetical protein